MLNYPVIDRDRQRLIDELYVARQSEPTPRTIRKSAAKHWFGRSSVGRAAIRRPIATI